MPLSLVSVNASQWLGEQPSHFLAASAGAGTGNILVGYLQSVLPSVDVRILTGVAGVLLVKYGSKAHALVSSYGRGMLINLVGAIISGAVGGGIGLLGGGSGGQTGNVFGGA